MTAEEFLARAGSLPDGERYELVDGRLVRMQAENYRHALVKRNVTRHFQDALRRGGRRECQSLPDGFAIRISDERVREPDALINCGSMRGDDLVASSPVVVVEVVSPSSHRVDTTQKLIDYFRLPSVHHYFIVLASDRRVIWHSRSSEEGTILTQILGQDRRLHLDPPGIEVKTAEFFLDLPDED